MKRISLIIAAIAMVMTFAQCKKTVEPIEDEGETIHITLDVSNGSAGSANDGSKVDIDPETGGAFFADGDVVYVANDGHYVGTLTYNKSQRQFSGDISANASTDDYLHFYLMGNKPLVEGTPTTNTTTFTVSISDQTTGYPEIAYAPSTVKYTEGVTAYKARLLNKCALVKFEVNTSSADSPTVIAGMNDRVTVDLSDNSFGFSQTNNNGTIKLAAGSGERWAILLPQEALSQGVSGSLYAENGLYEGTRPAIPAIHDNDYLTEGIALDVTMYAYEYVDLGLPSGTLWAICNVGSDTPEGYGSYFAWGETQTKSSYTRYNYQFYMNGDDNALTKYCSHSNYGYQGFTDNLAALLPEDDAATANLGEAWRMPTQSEWQELLNNTTHTWTTQNGVNGYLFTANGTSIFLPAGGYYGSSGLNSLGGNGYYWSITRTANDSRRGAGVHFDNTGSISIFNNYRDYGQSVRAVRHKYYEITATVNASEGGTVSGGGSFMDYTPCTLIATANEGISFMNWTENGQVVSTDATYTFNVVGNRNLVANFAVNYTISVSANPSEGGSVTGGGTYYAGQSCTVHAVANSGYTFSNWTENGSVVSFDANYTFTVDRDCILVANFIYYGVTHEYVDLGLPSGLLWATCNLGADSPEDYGYYFAWAETQPKSSYNWSSYRYCMGSEHTLTKYCSNASYGYNGFTDNKLYLDPEDDAATANWGADWYTPGNLEWQELFNNTTNAWTTQNGVHGWLFTANNGNSIFLPAAGMRIGTLYSAGSRGYYWANIRNDSPSGPQDEARYLRIESSRYAMSTAQRSHGHSVRAVRSAR